MKTLGTILVLGIALTLAGCGTNSNNGEINGNWTAALMGDVKSKADVVQLHAAG